MAGTPGFQPHEAALRLQEASERWHRADAAMRKAWECRAAPATVAALQAEMAQASADYMAVSQAVQLLRPLPPQNTPGPTPLVATLLDQPWIPGKSGQPAADPQFMEAQERYEEGMRLRRAAVKEYEAAMEAGDVHTAHELAGRLMSADELVTGSLKEMLAISRGTGEEIPPLPLVSCGMYAGAGFLLALALAFGLSQVPGLQPLAMLVLVVGPLVGIAIGAVRVQRAKQRDW